MSAPILFSGNQTSKLLQNQIVMANGELLANNGPLNLIKGGGFENGQLNGFSLFNTTLTSGVPTGSISAGATSIDTFAITASSPLGDTYSLSVGSSTGFVASQGFISPVFNIPNKLLASVLANKFFYSVVSGASNLNFSGTSSNTWAVYWYDVTNSKWVQPAGVYNLVGNSFAPPSTGTVQLNSTCTQARLAIICINNSGGAASMLFDDFSVGPQITSIGPAMSDSQAYTPTITGVGTTTNTLGWWRQDGDMMEGWGIFTCGTVPSSTVLSISLPGGKSIDSTKVPTTSFFNVGKLTGVMGTTTRAWPSNTIAVGGPYILITDTATDATKLYVGYGTSSQVVTKMNGDNNFATGDKGEFYFRVPIAGWSSNTVQSADVDNRLISAILSGSSTTYNGTQTAIVPTTIIEDTSGAMSGGVFTVKVPGDYLVSAQLQSTSSLTMNAVAIKQNSTVTNLGQLRAASGTANLLASGSMLLKCAVGDTLTFYGQSDGTSASIGQFTASIVKWSGSAVVQASSSVSASFALTSATVTTTPATIAIASVNWDSHNARSGNTYIIPLPGEYVASVRYSAGGNAIGFSSNILKGGSTISFPGWNTGSASYNVGHFHEVSFKANAGDVISWQWLTQSSSMTPALQTGDALTIRRVGN